MFCSVSDLLRESQVNGVFADSPTTDVPPKAVAKQRELLKGAAANADEAILHRPSLEVIARELADLVYAAYGTALTFGIELDDVVKEVHRANVSGTDVDVARVLDRQRRLHDMWQQFRQA